MILILIMLALAAAYSGGMWLWAAWSFYRNYDILEPAVVDLMERHTFHLGLCFILATGLFGINMAMGG